MASEVTDRQASIQVALRGAVWILGLAVVATALGQTLAVHRGDGSSINGFLFLELGWSHAGAASFEWISLVVVCSFAVLGFFWPRWFWLAPVTLYLLLEAWAGYVMRGYAFSDLTPAAHALRILTPLALALIARAAASPSPISLAAGVWLLRFALAAVFLSHGWEAFARHPAFIDLIISTAQRLFEMRIEEATASVALRVIGIVDIAVAVLLMVRSWRIILAWMLFWGLVTAASRMTSYGWGAYTDVLLRATHFAAPWALLWIISSRGRSAVAPSAAVDANVTDRVASARSFETVLGDSPIAR